MEDRLRKFEIINLEMIHEEEENLEFKKMNK